MADNNTRGKIVTDELKQQWEYLRTVEERSLKEIAEITNSNINTVAAHLYKHGIKLKKKELIEGRHAQWTEMRLDGCSVGEIAKKFHVGKNTLYRFFSRNNIILQNHTKLEKPEPEPEGLIYINGYWLQEDAAKRYAAIHLARKLLGEEGRYFVWEVVKAKIIELGLWEDGLWMEDE